MTRGPAEWIPYCGAAPLPGELLARWNLDPPLLLTIGLAVALACWLPRLRTPANAAALAVVLLLFVSPFCALGSALFSARVVHHLVLALVLAPLLALAFEPARWLERWSLPVLTALQAIVFWAWHAPALYSLALSNDTAFWLMQLSITATSALWWAKLRQSPAAASVAALLATMVQMGLLGALLTFAGRAFYAPHWLTTQVWGFSPLEDQQVAGLIMWAPGAAAYLLVAAAILYRSLGGSDARPAKA